MKRYLVSLTLAATWIAVAPPASSAQGTVPAEGQPKPAAAGTTATKAPEGASPAAPTSGGATKVTVRVPSGGSYTAYVQENTTAAPKTIQDKGELDLPAGAKTATVYVLDTKSGYAARKAVEPGNAAQELGFASPDFNLVQKVRVTVTGKDEKPVARVSVSLTDSGKNTYRKILPPASKGVAEFDFVTSGAATVSATPEGGNATTKEITVDLPKNETIQTISFALPEVTDVVEPDPAPAAATDESAAANAPAAAPAAPPAAAPAAAPAAQPAAPTPLPAAPASGGSDWGGTLIGFIFLAAIAFGGYTYMRNKGITAEMLLQKLGVQPDTAVAGGGSLAGANTGVIPAPGPAPASPPVVADPNQCPFCGQMKDPSGGCACTVTPGSLSAPAPGFGVGPAGASSGPRLVGMSGTYMGQVFPLSGTAVIGRDPSNAVPLDRDNTASRRHAQISDAGGAYQLQDLGSSNGTLVNGARVSEIVLNPGDEVAIGGTRFRFEV